MSMNARERRELEEIEHALGRADPRLAGLLTAPIDPGARFVRRLAGAFVAVVVVLIAAGLLLADNGMVLGGCLVLGMMPFTICLAAAVQRRSR